MVRYVVGFDETDQYVDIVGGKGAHLAELSRIEGIRVPAGFCVTTDAFERASADVGGNVESITVPDDVAAEVTRALGRLGEHAAYAVRSSATAEDSPTASFAGLFDTFLNVVGAASVLQHIARCWSSLFTERAVSYRLQKGLDHRQVRMAVVVQQMVFPRAAGTSFTADPATSHRKITCVEAGFGLGEAVVAGLVNPDVYKVRDGQVVSKTIATKERAIYASPTGGTEKHAIESDHQKQPALTDAQVIQLAAIGRRIEGHFGRPQDIEWCLVDDEFHIVQSRPITTLFPIPAAADEGNHVYVSVGHQQMMTDPMKPLGISLWQLTSPAPMRHAGGRLFVDVTQHLASPTNRPIYLRLLGTSDPLIGDALQTIVEREDFIPLIEDANAPTVAGSGTPTEVAPDPAVVDELIARREVSLETLKRDIRSMSGSALLDFILSDLQELRRFLTEPESKQVVAAAIEGSLWLNEHLQTWLGEKNAVGTLTQSVPHNVTSEMGLALLDVADVIRPYPDVIAYLQDTSDDRFLEKLPKFEGGQRARDAIEAYLAKYGTRCVGEIDITRPRWSDRPTALVPLLLADIKNFDPGAAKRRYEHGLHSAEAKEQELLTRLRVLPDGEQKAHDVKRMIDRIRAFVGFREYPKYHMISRYFVYRQALLREAERLVQAQVLQEKDDIFYLTFQELHDVVRTNQVGDELIRQRKDAFASYGSLTPPRVLTSDGEIVSGSYRRGDVPATALVGLAVSAGIVEGRARVVSDISAADLEAGDILVTAYTDPSWTPAFVAIAGLVTEVGGLMTHGAVIAREYGLPAVVGVEQATRLIRDGQRIRVHGTDGYVELLD